MCVQTYAHRTHRRTLHLNSRMPLGEDGSNVRRLLLLWTNSAMNLSRGVVTSGESA